MVTSTLTSTQLRGPRVTSARRARPVPSPSPAIVADFAARVWCYGVLYNFTRIVGGLLYSRTRSFRITQGSLNWNRKERKLSQNAAFCNLLNFFPARAHDIHFCMEIGSAKCIIVFYLWTSFSQTTAT